MARRRHRAATVLAAGIALGTAFACNVFSTIEQCENDSDCGGGATCDPVGGFCVRPVAPDAPSEAGSEASDAGRDSTPDAGPPRCDSRVPFGTPAVVKGFATMPVLSGRLNPDETQVYFSALNSCAGEECIDLFVAGRDNRDASFSSGSLIPKINCGQASEYFPSISADSLRIYFESSRMRTPDADGGCGIDVARIWSAKRDKVDDSFGSVQVDDKFDVPGALDTSPYLHPSGATLYFVSTGRPQGPGNQDIWLARIKNGLVDTIEVVDNVSTGEAETAPVISLDELTIYFARDPAGGAERKIWVAHRPTPLAKFDAPAPLDELNTRSDQIPSWISPDNCRLYYATNSENVPDGGVIDNYRLWVAERPLPKP